MVVKRRCDWLHKAHQAVTPGELALRGSVVMGAPLVDPDWTARTAQKFALESTLDREAGPAKQAIPTRTKSL